MEEAATIDLVPTLVPFILIIFVLVIAVVFLKQQRQKKILKQRLEKQESRINQHKKLLQVTIQVQESERKKIAENIHDELGASLSISRMLLRQMEDENSAQTEKIKEVREIIDTSLVSARRISQELIPLQLSKLGLKKALCALVSKAEKESDAVINIVISQSPLVLPWDVEIGLYRIYKELINNSLNHTKAKEIDISMYKEGDFLFCQYSDDSKVIQDDKQIHGIDFQNLESRIISFNGSIVFENPESEGFHANIKIPLITATAE